MAPRDWAQDKKVGVEWDKLTEAEWNDYFAFLHAKAIEENIAKEKNLSESRRAEIIKAAGKPPTLQDVIGKGKPEDVFDWIKIIGFAHKNKGLQLSSSQTGERLRFFSHNSDIQPPIEHLGPRAQLFKNAAKSMYEHGKISPPWTEQKVKQELYIRFKQIEKDLVGENEQDPVRIKWNQYWSDLKEHSLEELKELVLQDHLDTTMHEFRKKFQEKHPEVTSNMTDAMVLKDNGYDNAEAFLNEYRESIESEDNWGMVLENKIQDLQQQMLQAYRFKLFSGCQFLERLPNENDNQYKMREFRVQDFLQQLNKNMRKIAMSDNPDLALTETYVNIHKQLDKKVEKTVKSNIKNVKQNIRAGTSLANAIGTIEKELDRLMQSKEVAYLGENATSKLEQMISYKEKLVTH